MTPRECVNAVLNGRKSEYIPFTIWDNKLPDGELRRQILIRDACVIVKSKVYNTKLKTIKTENEYFVGTDGNKRVRTTYHTACGDLQEIKVLKPGTNWIEKHIFSGPEDYNAVIALIDDHEYIPCYNKFLEDDALFGQQGIARPATEKSPFFEIMYQIMGLMCFAVEWAENRDMVLKLYEALNRTIKKRLEIVACSPARYVIVDGNIDMSVVGADRFDRYYRPYIEEASHMMHAAGKMTGVHLDANNRNMIRQVAELPVDIIESLTPPPDCDLSVSEALKVWPGKIFMLNFPSSVHHGGPDAVRRAALEILEEDAGSGRIIVGVYEDIPVNDTLPILAETVRYFNKSQSKA